MAEEQSKVHSACVKGEFETVLQKIESGECSSMARFKGGYMCLHFAAAYGKLDVVRELIEKYGCDSSTKDDKDRTSLHFACYYGNVDVVKYLINEYNCKERYSPLHFALDADMYDPPLHLPPLRRFKHFEIVMFLVVDCSCKLNKKGKKKRISHDNLFQMACKYGVVEQVKCFVVKGLKPKGSLACDACRYGKLDILKYAIEEKHCDPSIYRANDNNTLLHIACSSGTLDVIRYLVRTGYCVATIDNSEGNTPLHLACIHKRWDVVKYLIQNEYSDPQKSNHDGDNCAHIACSSGNLEILKFLLEERKLDPTVCNEMGNSLLHLACINDHLPIVEYLIVNGSCSPAVENKNSELPLHLACQNETLEIVKLVSDFCPPKMVKGKTTPLHIASSKGNLEIVKYLVNKRNWNPQDEDSNGSTALHFACGFQGIYKHGFVATIIYNFETLNLELVLFLVEEGQCDPMKPSYNYGDSPIETACSRCDLELLKILTSVDVNCLDQHANSSLHLACKYCKISIVRYLTKEKQCDQTIQNSSGKLPLHIACEKRSLDMVKLVSDCDINVQASNGDTPLHIACRCKEIEITRYLVQKKGFSATLNPDIYSNLQIHIACESGDLALVQALATLDNVNYLEKYDIITPLKLACRQKKIEVVRFLVKEMNAHLNTETGYNKQISLHDACQFNSLEIVQLVDDCEDVNVRDSEGNTPLHVACKSGTVEIVKYLIEEKYCDPTLENKLKELPLHIACQSKSLDMVKLVSDHDLNYRDRNCCTHFGDTPLHIALRFGAVDIATYLIESGKYDLSIANNEGVLPIHYACILSNSLKLVKLTTDFGGHNLASIATASGVTPLHFACLYGKIKIVKFLIEDKKVDPTVCDRNGQKPLHYACTYCFSDEFNEDNVAVSEYLVNECGCNPLEESEELYNIMTAEQISPLEKSIQAGNLKLVQALMNTDLNVNHLNSRGDSMLHVACRYKQADIVKFLVEDQRYSQMIPNRAGKLPIHIACESNSLDIVQLVSSNCRINMKMADGKTPLHIACKHNNIKCIEYLMMGIQNCSDPTIADDDGYLPLHLACQQNSLEVVKLVSNCDVNAKTKDGETPLHIVLKSLRYCRDSVEETIKIAEYLVNEKHSNLNLPDNEGKLPLHLACECCSLEVVRLVSSNCDVNARTQFGDTPLHLILELQCRRPYMKERYKIIEYLITELKCDSTLPDGSNVIPIHTVCRQGQLDVVKLLTNPESVNCKDEEENTPLHVACCNRKLNIQIVNFLVSVNQSCVNMQNKDGDTPLHLACKSAEVVRILVKGNTQCDISISNNKGQTPLHIACGEGHKLSLKAIELLSKNDPKVINSRTLLGDTPLHIACSKRLSTIANYLINCQCCNVDIQNMKGELPLHIACQNLFNSIIEKLCIKCNINASNESGDTALHILCRQGCWDQATCMVEYLFRNTQCDANIPNHHGELPLHLACLHSLSIVKEVGTHTSDPNVISKSGDTPLHVACRLGNCNVVKYLVQNMHCELSIQNYKGLLPLHIACCHGSVELAKIVSNCKDPNRQGTSDDEVSYSVKDSVWSSHKTSIPILSGDTPLHIACRTDEPKLVEFLLKQKLVKANMTNKIRELPLHIACRYRSPLSLNIVQLLGDCDVNAQTKCGDTALHIAVHCAKTSVVKYLVQQKECSVNIPNEKGELPLHIFCDQYPSEIIELVSNPGNVNARTRSGDTPLHISCRNKYYSRKTVEYLTKIKEIDLNLSNDDEEMPLHLACRINQLDIVKLVSAGDVSINARNSVGNTPLLEVFMRKSFFDSEIYIPLDLVNYLITDKRCDPSLANKQNELPLHLACRKGCRLEIVKLVSEVNINLQTLSGNSPLHEACKTPSLERAFSIVQYLTEVMHCDLNLHNNDHEFPLHLACRRRSLNIVKLVSKCNDPNSRTTEGNTPLHEVCICASESYEESYDINGLTVKHLLKYLIEELGCSSQCQNNDGRTALH